MKTKQWITGLILILSVYSVKAQNMQISGGFGSSGMICANGYIYTWGNNDGGESGNVKLGVLGRGYSGKYDMNPGSVSYFTTNSIEIMKLDAGSGGHFLALACDGKIYSWGINKYGQCGKGTTSDVESLPIIVKTGQQNDPSGNLTGVIYVSGGNDESFAILSTSEVVSWGQDDKGQLGGNNCGNKTTPVYVLTSGSQRLKNIIKVEAGDANGYALSSSGIVYSWGAVTGDFGGQGMLGRNTANNAIALPVTKEDGTLLTDIVDISAGDVHCLAIDAYGQVWSWGNNGWSGQCGTGEGGNIMFAKKTAGIDGNGFLKNVKKITAGRAHSVAVLTDGTVAGWGLNDNYQYGNLPQTKVPKLIPGISNVADVSDGDLWTFFMTKDGKIYVVGDNNLGQLGLGTSTDVQNPTLFNPPCILPDPCPEANLGDDIYVCPGETVQLYSGFDGAVNLYQYIWTGPGVSGSGNKITATKPGIYTVTINYIGTNMPICNNICPPAIDTIRIIEMNPPEIDGPGEWCNNTIQFKICNAKGLYALYQNPTGGTPITYTDSVSGNCVFAQANTTDGFIKNGSTYEAWIGILGEQTFDFGFTGAPTCGSTENIQADKVQQSIEVFNDVYIQSWTFQYETEYNGQTKTYQWQAAIYEAYNNQNGQLVAGNELFAGDLIQLQGVAQGSKGIVTVPLGYKMKKGNSYFIGLKKGSRPVVFFKCLMYPLFDDLDGKQAVMKQSNKYGNPPGTNDNYYGSFYDIKLATASEFDCWRIKITAIQNCPFNVDIKGSSFCKGNCTQLEAKLKDGVPPFHYAWSDVALPDNPGPHNVCPQSTTIYWVTVTDAAGYTATDSAIVTVHSLPVLTIIPTPAKCYGSCDGSANTTITGGSPAYLFKWSNNQTVNPAVGLCTGNYSVTVNDSKGCTGTASVTITQPAPIKLSVSVKDALCGQSDGTATITPTGGTSPYTYQWDVFTGNQTSQSAVNLSAGTYSVTVKDNNGCTADTIININTSNGPNLSFFAIDASCHGYSDGIINLTITGGTQPININWSNGSSLEDLYNIPADSYTVTVTDGMGCSAKLTAIVQEPDALLSSVTGSDLACNGDGDGQINLTVSGGTTVYSFVWSNSATTEDLSNLNGGTYAVTVTDANSCKSYNNITINEPTLLQVSISNTPISAAGACDATATVNPTGGTLPYSFVWDDVNDQTTQTAIGLCTGNYCVTVKDANGCLADICIFISTISLSTSQTDINCFGECTGTATVSVNLGSAPYQYQWSNGLTTQTISGLCAGSYTVTVTDDNTTTATSTVNIKQPEEIILTFSGSDLKCFNDKSGKVKVSVTGGTPPYSYLWNNNVQTDINPSLSAGTYTVTITDINHCTKTGSITIYEPPVLTSTINGTDALCSGTSLGSAEVTPVGGTPPYQYKWNNNFGDDSLISKIPAGTYTVTITDANGCITTNQIVIDEPYPVTLLFAKTDLSCFGDTDGSVSTTATGGTPDYVYLWNNNVQTDINTSLPAGIYTVTVTDLNGCTATGQVEVLQPEKVTVQAPVQGKICIGECTTLTGVIKGGTPGYKLLWSDQTTGTSITVCPETDTEYSVTVTDMNGCSNNTSITVGVYPPLSISLHTEDDTLCPFDCTLINIKASGGKGASYTFSLDNGTTVKNPFQVCPMETETFTVIIKDECTTPQEQASINIWVFPIPQVQFEADTVKGCAPLSVNFNATSSNEGGKFLWSFGDLTGNNMSTAMSPFHIYKNHGEYDVTLTVTSVAGCKNTKTIKKMISVYPVPVASFLAHPQVTSILDPLIQFENQSSTLFLSQWNFGDGSLSQTTHPQHQYVEPGNYLVKLYVESEHGCHDITESEVIINDIYSFYAPEAFTPDNDKLNDLFSPIGKGINKAYWYLAVFDRWGEKIYETQIYDVDENGKVLNGWDGRIHQQEIGETGVYSWICKYRNLSGKETTKSGNVILIR